MPEIPEDFTNYSGWKPQNVMRDIDALKGVARSQAQAIAKVLVALATLETQVNKMKSDCENNCAGDAG